MTGIQTETATRAAYRAIGNKLVAQSSAFADRVYARFHPFSANIDEQIFPYVVMVFVGGGDADITRTKDAEINIQVVCFSDDADESETGAVTIDNALDGFGTQESSPSDRLDGQSWFITSVTAGRVVSGQEFYKESSNVFMDGKVYRITMEIE
jgi:hypothetical protein